MDKKVMKDINRLNTILKYCDKIEEVMREYGEYVEDFLKNTRYQDLCSFYTQQIGENAKNLSENIIKKYPEIKWEDIRQTRNDIAHTYEWIDPEMIWNAITEDIPILRKTCESILHELRGQGRE
ncbi:MAG: DUF86 domain-containing protein [Methanomassiliicoccaceae archaeon]|nr:DUF86 domain-containing protein [Methanomassiliicoccaceae archaeon]